MRIVGDFRGLNAAVESHSCEVPSIPGLWLRTQQHDQTSVVDLEDESYQVRIPRWARPFFGFRVGNKYYRYTRLLQGYVNAPFIFIDFIKRRAPKRMADPRVAVYMDDVVGYGLPPHELLLKVAATGLVVNPAKTTTTTTPARVKILGLQVENRDSAVIWTASKRVVEKYTCRKRDRGRMISSRERLMLCGALQFYRTFLPGLRLWVKPWYEWMKGTLRTTLDRPRTCDLPLPDLDFVVQLPTRQEMQVYTDASEERSAARQAGNCQTPRPP
eukprot:GHVT01059286.1.p1 GENE.GHVT01059286.1~~GHVT01059286.1.p1  ORF type:complete len:272 (+),score=15.40 GHVT01059286.1:187-1002(+)